MAIDKRTLFYSLIIGILVIIAVIFSYRNASDHINTEQFNVQYLSSEEVVIPYLKQNRRLPDYYITKKEARKTGWKPEKGNLCNILPGKIIGGDVFTNREKTVPYKRGRKWFEADLNYNCNQRGTDRIVFSDDGLIFVTYDHYKTFEPR